MNYSKQKFKNYLLHDTAVENLFISDFAKKAPGDFVKVYLLALMHANAGEALDNMTLAKMLDLQYSDVLSAWDYWEEQGVIKRYETENEGEFDVEFLNLKDEFFGHGAAITAASSKSSEASKMLEDNRLSKLYKDIEQATGRLLESKEPEAISTWLYNFEIDPSVILLGYKYCTKNKTSNRYRYVETVIKDWKKRGLESVGDIEEFLGDTDKRYAFYKTICKELGFLRNPTEPEKRMMDAWIDEYDFSQKEVLDACKKTTGISNPNFNYVNSVLLSQRNEAKPQAAKVKLSIEDLYQKVRDENLEKANRRKKEIFEKQPRLLEIVDELKDISFKISKNILRGTLGKDELEKDKERQRQLTAEKEKLLKALGLDKDYLEPIYSCPKCKDTGYLKDGTKCECFANMVNELRIINEQ